MFEANFIVTPTFGDVLATEFTVTNLTTGSASQYTWNTGYNKLIYNVTNPVFTYPYPGVYTITLSAVDYEGNLSVVSKQISADIVYRDYVKFTQIPESYPDPGKVPVTPFEITVVSSNPDKPMVIDLFAVNSKSTPYDSVPDKWSFLTPTWKFLDTDLKVITSINVTPTPIYKNNKVVAVSGTALFYYVDSMSTGNPVENCPILLTATLRTEDFNNFTDTYIYPYKSYANNETVKAGLLWQVNDLFPNLLKITGNYIDNINPKQWKDIKTTTLITCHSNRSLLFSGAEDKTSEVIFSYPSNNEIGSRQPINLTLTGLTPNLYSIDEEPLYFQSTDNNGSRIGGYALTTVTALTSIQSTSIVAQATAFTNTTNTGNNQFFYPQGYSPNLPVWVSNPEKNTLNKITLVPYPDNCPTINYFKNDKVLVDGYIKNVQVPYLNTSNTFNYTMSGFSGIYGMAIDPRNYDLIACDAELDRIYRYSNTGDLLKTFELTGLNDYNPLKKMYDYWTWQTPSPYASATSFTFYSPTIRSTNPANYIMSLGGIIQPADFINITPVNTFRIIASFPGDSAGLYPDENLKLDVMQLFSPSLPEKCISSLTYWTTSSPGQASTFSLSSNKPLKTEPGHYIVSVDGVLQTYTDYTISDINKTITFNEPLPGNVTLHVLYVPEVNSPATWTRTFTSATTSFSLTGNSRYRADKESCFIVNYGGIIQPPVNYTFDINNQRLVLSTPPPDNTVVTVTQFSVPETINNIAAYTPSYVSLDKDYNIWVSLFNSVSVLKFDKDFNLLFSVAPTGVNWQSRSFTNTPIGIDYQSSQFGSISDILSASLEPFDYFYDEFFLKPPVVETDKDNNCWVTYAHPLCSILVKYGSNGNILSQIPFSKNETPINIAVNSQNNVWVSCMHNSSYTYTALSGSIVLYDTETSTLLDQVTGISRPSHISLDRNNNLWFTHSTRRIGYYNTNTSVLSTWTLELTGGFSLYTISSSTMLSGLKTYDELENQEDEELGGLAVDVFDRVWVIDSTTNFAWVISATPDFNLSPIRQFKIVPDVDLGYYVDVNDGSTYTEDGDFQYKSAQATGDWTGNRWYQKYTSPLFLSAVAMSGISVPYAVSDFVNDNQIRRVNESFNNADYLKSLALPENLNSNITLFDKFFAASVGTGYLSANQDLGQTVYERIANFTSNHADVDTCNIDQLLSLAEQTGTPASDYSALYPVEIRNMLDIASTPRSKLWGIKDDTFLMPQSIGEKFNTFTDYITAGEQIVLKNKFDSTTTLVTVPLYGGTVVVYPLSSFEGYGFAQPVTDNYIFYKLDPVYTENYVDNLIDWESPYTTQSPTASTLEEWYGDAGAIENAFRYLLTKNLFLK